MRNPPMVVSLQELSDAVLAAIGTHGAETSILLYNSAGDIMTHPIRIFEASDKELEIV